MKRLALALLLVGAPALADERRHVALEVHGEDARVLEDTIRELLARLGLVVGDGDDVLAAARIDVTSDGAHVVVRDHEGHVLLDRRITGDDGTPIARERVAHAVRGAVEASILAEQDRVALAPAPVPAPAPAAAPPPAAPDAPRAPSHLALDVSALGGAGAFASGTGPVARVGGALALSTRAGLRPSLAVGAFYAFPFEAEGSALTARAKLLSVRVLPAIEVVRRGAFAVDTAAGGGLDVLTVEPASSTLPASSLAPATTRADPILTGALTGKLALAPDVVLTLTLAADVALRDRTYVFDNRGERVAAFEPWTVRPTMLAGLSFTAFGEAPFR